MQIPGIPKGTRDFSPTEMMRRNYIFDTIRKVFQLFGYLPIETPAMENLSTLLGKYGEEGDKLLFKVLNSGDFLGSAKLDPQALNEKTSGSITHLISEKGLRYDLTVPFARFVVQHRNDITFPFKRYQIQPVWRADRPQKGRYREFYQCDVDVIGSNALLYEAELIQIISEIFKKLNVNIEVKLNNRKILAGIAEVCGVPEKFMDITVAIDKLEKTGLEKVIEELSGRGIPEAAIEKLVPILSLKGDNNSKLTQLKILLAGSATGMKGIEELETIFGYLQALEVGVEIHVETTLARGLNYYTGAIIEVKAKDVAIGSICGGGRYDDLTGVFGLKGISGVGVSFGADRIYDVLLELKHFPEETHDSSQVLIINFGKDEEAYGLRIVNALRKAGINAEIYPENAALKKQMTYADNKKIPFVALAGSNEIQAEEVTLKDMKGGAQQKLPFSGLIPYIISVLE